MSYLHVHDRLFSCRPNWAAASSVEDDVDASDERLGGVMLYFFNMSFGEIFFDHTGTELASVEAAFKEALLYACEVLRARPDLLGTIGEAKVEVMDTDGQLITGIVVSALAGAQRVGKEDR